MKYGDGRVVDHACRKIRLKQTTRMEGIELKKAYQNRQIKKFDLFLKM
jgi:hypothetical protein